METEFESINVADLLSQKDIDGSGIDKLKYQSLMTDYLKQYIHSKDQFDINHVLEVLDWILRISDHFCNKMGLERLHHGFKKRSSDSIARSSYRFCSQGYDCQYHYELDKYSGCRSQHYVHNIVYADIEALISYLQKVKHGWTKLNYQEVITSLNTISFVVNHMYKELYYVDFYHQGQSEKYHQVRQYVHSHTTKVAPNDRHRPSHCR